DCAARDAYATRLLGSSGDSLRDNGSRFPASAADLMLRIVSQIVDRYLDLRRELSRQLDHWQAELLAPNTRFTNWSALLDARLALHALDDVAEDQRTAMLDWTAALETWPPADSGADRRELDLLKVRSRDVLEHIERVVRHVRRLEQNAETTVQMHFSAQGHRTNEIMRTLTVLTAVFLPLNFITGFFGMNFDFLPLVHRQAGIWWTIGTMSLLAVGLVGVFWRKHYLARTAR
ncbi:MAG: magnesium transporter CorA family protein, partial [Betaproteobacteria bacterium]